MTELLLLVGVLLLVAANGFFVAAEFALVRAREGRVEALRDEGAAARRSCSPRSTRSTSTCPPASSASRWRRSASASWASRRSASLIERDRRLDLAPRGIARDLDHDRLHDHDGAPHHGGRAGAEDLRDRACGADGASRAAAALVPRRVQPADLAAEHRLERDAAGGGSRPERRSSRTSPPRRT